MKTTSMLGAIALLLFTGGISAQENNSTRVEKGLAETRQFLKNKPRLGMSLPELEVLWGKSINIPLSWAVFHCERGEKEDWKLFDKIKEECKVIHFEELTKENKLNISGWVWNNKCVALSVGNGLTVQESITLSGTLLPGVSFSGKRPVKAQNFAMHSKDKNKRYMFRYCTNSGGYFEVMDCGYVRFTLEEREKKAKEEEARKKAERLSEIKSSL